MGGNKGKWACASTKYNGDVQVTLMDLPGQLNMDKARINDLGLTERVSFFPKKILDEQVKFPTGFDAVWMSHFLDCFSEAEIVSILKRCHASVDDNGYVFILEHF